MRFLRRSQAPTPAPAPRGGVPVFIERVLFDSLRPLLEVVARTLGPSEIQNVEDLRNVARIQEYRITELMRQVSDKPPTEWPAVVEAFYGRELRRIRAGDALAAATRTFDDARPLLRPFWMRSGQAPDGAVTVPAFGDTVEALALVTEEVIRLVQEDQLLEWRVSVEVALDEATRRVLGEVPTRVERVENFSPETRAIVTRGPYGGAIIRRLAELDPGSVGDEGTLIWSPRHNEVLYRPLPGLGLRDDYRAAVGVLFFPPEDAAPLIDRPVWRRPSGELRVVAHTLDTSGDHPRINLDDARFAGLLAVHAPAHFLDVASWAQGVLDEQRYTRFAGLVAMAMPPRSEVHPDAVRHFGTTFGLPSLARLCASAPADRWPAMVTEALQSFAVVFKQDASEAGQGTMASSVERVTRDSTGDAGLHERAAPILAALADAVRLIVLAERTVTRAAVRFEIRSVPGYVLAQGGVQATLLPKARFEILTADAQGQPCPFDRMSNLADLVPAGMELAFRTQPWSDGDFGMDDTVLWVRPA